MTNLTPRLRGSAKLLNKYAKLSPMAFATAYRRLINRETKLARER